MFSDTFGKNAACKRQKLILFWHNSKTIMDGYAVKVTPQVHILLCGNNKPVCHAESCCFFQPAHVGTTNK